MASCLRVGCLRVGARKSGLEDSNSSANKSSVKTISSLNTVASPQSTGVISSVITKGASYSLTSPGTISCVLTGSGFSMIVLLSPVGSPSSSISSTLTLSVGSRPSYSQTKTVRVMEECAKIGISTNLSAQSTGDGHSSGGSSSGVSGS